MEDFKVPNNYALDLKATNLESSMVVMAKRDNPNEFPILVQKKYIRMIAIREGFSWLHKAHWSR